MLRLKAGGTTAETARGATIGVSATGNGSRIMSVTQERKDFFSEKKKQKAFVCFGFGLF
jgi:hypothetical protein